MSTAVWESEAFGDELRAFVVGAVGEPTTFVPLRVRPWSTVWRATTPDGVFYAKDNCPGQRHEAALLVRLAEVTPAHVVRVAAADPGRGLLLTHDEGATVRRSAPDGAAPDVDLWCRVAKAAAVLQREAAPHLGSLGLTVLDPAAAVDLVRGYVDDLTALPADDPRRLSDDGRRVVEGALPDVARWSEQVAALGLPLTLQHNDLHDDNVLAGSTGDGTVRFFDFGDAVLSEPLGVLRIPLWNLEEGLACAPDDPRLARVADAALEVWSDVSSPGELRAALPVALQLARLARVESWWRCLQTMSPAELVAHGDSAAGWLVSLAPARGQV